MQIPMGVPMSPELPTFMSMNKIGNKILLATDYWIVDKTVDTLNTDTGLWIVLAKSTRNLFW